MTRLTYPKQDENQLKHPDFQDLSIPEADQVQYLKRLLVTVKQHYENSLHQQHIQLQSEQNDRLAAEKEVERIQLIFTENQNHYEEELQALRSQQNTLKEMLKKAQDELTQFLFQSNETVLKIEDKDQHSIDAEKEVLSLRQELEQAQFKIALLNEEVRQHLEEQKQSKDNIETAAPSTSSHDLYLEIEIIKQMLAEDLKETKALEGRYIEVLNEKISLDHQIKRLQQQFEEQSSSLIACQEQIHKLEERKISLELSLETKEAERVESCQERLKLQMQVEQQIEERKEKELIQSQYEQLKDELKQVSENLEEAIQSRVQLDEHLNYLELIVANQETQLQDLTEQMRVLYQEKEAIEIERDQMRLLLQESESQLKIAQQHMAKKVKEAAFLSEQLEGLQSNFTEFLQMIEDQKGQIAHLQANIDFYEKQEIKLQEQLQEALKGNESQIAKWEEKYFLMHDKWQESEKEVRELKKFEEKHLQMQSLLANLGHFMGGASNSSQPPHSMERENGDVLSRPFAFESSVVDENLSEVNHESSLEGKYNLFGMPHPL